MRKRSRSEGKAPSGFLVVSATDVLAERNSTKGGGNPAFLVCRPAVNGVVVCG